MASNKRPLFLFTPEKGKHYILTKFNKEVEEVFYDPNNPTEDEPSLLFLIPYFWQLAQWQLEWTERMSKDEAIARREKIKNDPFRSLEILLDLPTATEGQQLTQEGKESEKTDEAKSLQVIVVRKEPVWYLFHLEAHPVIVPFTTEDGSDFLLIVQAAYQTNDAILAKTSVKNYLSFAEVQISEALGTIGRNKTFDQALKIDSENFGDFVSEGITIADNSSETRRKKKSGIIKVIKYLNKEKFRKLGFELTDLMFTRVLVTRRSHDILEQKENLKKAVLQNQIAEEQANAFKKHRQAQIDMQRKEGIIVSKNMRDQLQEVYRFDYHESQLVDKTTTTIAQNLGATHGKLTLLGESFLSKKSEMYKEAVLANMTTEEEPDVAGTIEEANKQQKTPNKRKGGKYGKPRN